MSYLYHELAAKVYLSITTTVLASLFRELPRELVKACMN